jgi:uncharacterized protein
MRLADEKYVLLTTFRKVGPPVPSPVWIVELDDGRVGFSTSSGSGKVKRLAHTSRVTLQPCDSRGNVTAGTETVDGTAELVTGADLEEITRKVKAKYGFMTQLTKLVAAISGIVKRNRMPYADQGVVITLAE